MKILQTPPRFYPYIGGTEQLCYYLSRELVRKGHRVTVVCSDEGPAKPAQVDGVEVKRLGYIAKIANTNITLSLPAVLLREDFDVVHTHLPHPWSADISALTASLRRKPLFLTYHNDITGTGFSKMLAATYNACFLPFLLRKAKKIFITNPAYAGKSRFLGKYSGKITVTPAGVDTSVFKADSSVPSEPHSIFFLSLLDRFHVYKGLEYLIRAIKKLSAAKPVRLYIGGAGELLPYYKKMVEEAGMTGSVEFLGFLTQKRVVECYNRCAVFVLPSVSSVQEGFGMVALEAMACGKPVVVTDIVGTAADICSAGAGMLVKPKDSDALAEAIGFIMDSPEEGQRMGQNGQALVTRMFSWKTHADIVEREYAESG